MLYGRDGDKIYFHGSSAARILKRAKTGIPMTMTVRTMEASLR
jgi:nitroimidazol reductase NimA-like FMN-containing flavoprotein (pyridoxamine 5'-phosphate oxidase superfamily)